MKDTKGREITMPYDVRRALVTATASITTGTASTILSGDAGDYLDLVEITMSNNSDAAVAVTLSNDGTTIRTYTLPASSITQFKYDAPVKQNTIGIDWVVDIPDITGTTVVADAIFIKNGTEK